MKKAILIGVSDETQIQLEAIRKDLEAIKTLIKKMIEEMIEEMIEMIETDSILKLCCY